MGNSIGKNHPFRASITHSDSEAVSSASTSNGTSKEPIAQEEEKEGIMQKLVSAFLRLSPRARLLTLGLLGGSICYGYVTVYDAVFGPSLSSAATETSARMQFAGEDDEFQMEREEPGWIARTFCRGVKRSALCD